MKLSLLILNYNTRGLLRQCLKHIRLANLTIPHEIIVVDNASADGSLAMLQKEFPEVKIFPQEKNLGYAAGNNVGLTAATGEYVFILNPDIFFIDNAAQVMTQYMDEHQDIALLGPRLLNADHTVQHSCFQYYRWHTPIFRRTPLRETGFGKMQLDEIFMKDKNLDDIQDVDWLLGGAIMVRRQALDKIGFLDTRYFLYFEDMDWCRTAHRAGQRVAYFPKVSMIHLHARSSDQLPWFLGLFNKLTRIHIKSAIKYFAKWRALESEKDRKESGILISNEKLPMDL